MEGNKTHFESIDEYIFIFPPEIQEILQKLRKVIQESVPDATEKISWLVRNKKGVEWATLIAEWLFCYVLSIQNRHSRNYSVFIFKLVQQLALKHSRGTLIY
jgi:hypothetical protein